MTPEALETALRRWPRQEVRALPGRRNHLRAGVLVPLRLDGPPTVLLTLRAPTLSAHAGEVSFPGGKPDPQDDGPMTTALREAREELGVEGARVLGRLSSMPLYTSDYRLEPFVAALGSAPLRPEPAEVARVLELPLERALGQPWIDAIPWSAWGEDHLSPVFEIDGHLVFGGTAHTLHELLQVAAPLLGRPLPPLRSGALDWETVFRRGGARVGGA